MLLCMSELNPLLGINGNVLNFYMKYSIFTDGLLCMFYASYFNLNILQSNNIYIFQV